MSTTVEWWRSVLAGEGGTLTTAGDGDRYLALPSRQRARVVVDSETRTAVRDAVGRMLRARGVPGASVLSHPASALLSRLGQQWVVRAPDSLRDHLGSILDTEVTLSVAIGPPRPNQKPVVRIYAGSDLIAIAKLGPDSHTRTMVANESDWLSRLHRDPIHGMQTPELIHAGEFGRSELLVMSVLPLDDDLGIDASRMPNHLLPALWAGAEGVGLGASPYWNELEARAGEFDDDMLASLLEAVRADARFETIHTGLCHGDWSPWNVSPAADGSWFVWDWERAAEGAPLAFDLLHLALQYGSAGFMGSAAEARATSIELGCPERDFGLSFQVYLAELLVRHHEAGQSGSARDVEVRELIASRAATLPDQGETSERTA